MTSATFDKNNPNWSEQPGANDELRNKGFLTLNEFLQAVQNFANDELRNKGFLTLNEIYKLLGFEQTEEGALAGWAGDTYIDFGISEGPINLTFNTNSDNVFRDK